MQSKKRLELPITSMPFYPILYKMVMAISPVRRVSIHRLASAEYLPEEPSGPVSMEYILNYLLTRDSFLERKDLVEASMVPTSLTDKYLASTLVDFACKQGNGLWTTQGGTSNDNVLIMAALVILARTNGILNPDIELPTPEDNVILSVLSKSIGTINFNIPGMDDVLVYLSEIDKPSDYNILLEKLTHKHIAPLLEITGKAYAMMALHAEDSFLRLQHISSTTRHDMKVAIGKEKGIYKNLGISKRMVDIILILNENNLLPVPLEVDAD